MRIALVSPYSWTYPGGVLRHIEALADELNGRGHDATILAPFDPDDRFARRLHRGARPQVRELPEHVIPLGRTIGLPANGAVSNLSFSAEAIFRMRHEMRHGAYDVVHVHEPIAPMLGWDAVGAAPGPTVGTFHAYSTSHLTNQFANSLGAWRRLNRLAVRIAVSDAAAWTAQRFFGGRYRIIPNGVELDEAVPLAAAPAPVDPRVPLRLVFVGPAVERKGLPVLLRAFEALREHVPVTLTVMGAEPEEIAPMLLDDSGVVVLGKVSDEEKHRQLRAADVLCAPSLGGESFGMVLTEAFAAATPVVASDIAGYAAVVEDGVNGCLVPRGDPRALAEKLLELARDPQRRCALAHAARASAERYAWPRIAGEVLEAYEEAIETPVPATVPRRAAGRLGLRPADGLPAVRARRLPSLEPPPPFGATPAMTLLRRVGLAALAIAGVTLAWLALQRIGISHIATSLVSSRPAWVVLGLALMCGAMAMRGVAWQAILQAAPTGRRVRLGDSLQGTFVGVLMSATLPARLGEPARALVVARRLGRARETFPIVLGTVVSQTVLNLLALAILGAITFSSASLLNGHHDALLAASIAPLVVLCTILVAPALLPRAGTTGSTRWRALAARLRGSLRRVRQGLSVFRRPRLATVAVAGQLGAWALQCASCYTLLVALGLDRHVGVAAAAGVLFAVNVTAAIPATPSNLGVFQAACVAVLHGAFHVDAADALAYGIILQAVEIATAVIMGAPALVKEGLSWREVRLRAMHAAPLELRPQASADGGAVALDEAR